MASINQIEKTDYHAVKIDYTSKDYINILDDLINSIPGITQKWNSTDENDPGMILVKLMAIVGDMLFFNQDMQTLEVYPNSVTQRKNAATIYRLIGYKMRWYKSAIVQADVINTYVTGASIPSFCTFTNEDKSITYCTFSGTPYELKSNQYNNGLVTTINLVQGIPVTPIRVSSNPYPDPGKPWHSIYGFNYTTDDIINNRIYLKDYNIDQDHIMLIDDQNEAWTLYDNIYLQKSVGRFFEFGIDVNDQPYIELVDYWNNFNVKKFKIFYVKSLGSNGQIFANALKHLTGNVWARDNENNIYNVSSYIYFTNYDSTLGYDPETPDEARKESVKYLNTMDTLITLADFERATLRLPGVANVRATDLTNDPGTVISYSVGNINMDTVDDIVDGKIVKREIIDRDHDMQALANYIADPNKYPLTSYQLKLADCNQDGVVNSADLDCFTAYFNGDYEHSGYIGTQKIEDTQTLDSFVVKLYILRTEDYEDREEEGYIKDILEELYDYKVLPLTILVDLNSINKYYWTIKGSFLTKTPLSRDELQTIILNINNTLSYKYAIDKINFNTLINYKEVIETILEVDNRILMVDLDPIEYVDIEGRTISKEQLTGIFTYDVEKKDTGNPSEDTFYQFTIPGTPLLPGSVMINVMSGGQYTLRDNNNGSIYNIDNVLTKKGSIDYITGLVTLQFTSKLDDDIHITYTHNATNIAAYKNLNTQTFSYDSSSLEKDYMQDLV